MIWLIITAFIALLVYYYIVKPTTYWKLMGVPQASSCAIFSSGLQTILGVRSFIEIIKSNYNNFKHKRYVGMYQLQIPTLMLKDPDLIKQIGVKDFDHFQDHRVFIPETADPLWGKNLFALQGHRWKEMRATLSPSFTSSKMRMIFRLIDDCAQNFTKYFQQQKEEDIRCIEIKDVFTRFTNNVIASVAFGIGCDALANRNNEFYLMGKDATDLTSTMKAMKLMMLIFLPKISQILGIRLFNNKVAKFFRGLVKETIETREKKGIIRPDMIHLLMEARKHGMKYEENTGNLDAGFATVEESDIGKATKQARQELSDDDITAQALIFFFAGFETVSTQMCLLTYELALNPEIQDKLRKEIDDTFEDCEGKLTYEALLKMKYLDMVVSEGLRKWPAAAATDRVVTKPYVIQPITPDETPVHLNVGEVIWIPTIAIHHDPDYYPNPEKFDPERFSEENKNRIIPYTYLPFGVGPRNCIGSRFALLELKAIIFNLLRNFEIVPNEKTQIPLKLNKRAFNFSAKDGVWVGLKPRKAV